MKQGFMRMCAFPRVRKLIGKPALPTIADCESEARRIQSPDAGEHCVAYPDCLFLSDILGGLLNASHFVRRESGSENYAAAFAFRNGRSASFGFLFHLGCYN